MQYTLYKWSILLMIGLIFLNGKNIFKHGKEGSLLGRMCILMARMNFAECWPSNRENCYQTNLNTDNTNIFETKSSLTMSKDPEKLNNFNIEQELLVSYLNDLHLQESHLRIKKAVSKQDEIKVPACSMKKKLRQLMSNITGTLTDMDWYFGLNQLDSSVNSSSKANRSRNNKQIGVINNTHKISKYQDQRDVFLDSFIEQMYEVSPLVLEKLKERIDGQYSNKRQVRLAHLQPDEIEEHTDLFTEKSPSRYKPRKTVIKTVLLKKSVPDYNDNENYIEIADRSTNSYFELDRNFPGNSNIIKLEEFTTSTSSTTPTTVESFYDYPEYNKNNVYDDLNDISDYDINKNDIEYSTEAEGHHVTKYWRTYLKKTTIEEYKRLKSRKKKYRS